MSVMLLFKAKHPAAMEFALIWWRKCKRPDLSEEDKVRGAIMRYREFIEVAAFFKEVENEQHSSNR